MNETVATILRSEPAKRVPSFRKLLPSSASPAPQNQIVEPSENAEMDETLNKTPKRPYHNAEGGNRVAVEAIELRE